MPEAIFFNKLLGFPLPNLHHVPGRRMAYSRQTRPSSSQEDAILNAAAIIDSIDDVKLREIELSGICYYIG